MSTIGKQGFLFSLDLLVAFIAMLLITSLMLMHLGVLKEQELEGAELLALQRNAVFLADSIVKNRNEKQPLLGSAMFDEEKHRVLQNELDEQLLLNAKQTQGSEFIVKKLSLIVGEEEKNVLLSKGGENCLALDRVVFAGGRLGKLEVVVCEK